MTPDQKRDLESLLRRPEFVRFLWRVIQMAGIFTRTANGSDSLDLARREGSRNLGFDILFAVEQAQPDPQEDGLATLFQMLREEAIKPQEKPDARRYDRNAELNTGDD